MFTDLVYGDSQCIFIIPNGPVHYKMHGMENGRDKNGDQVDQEQRMMLPVDQGQVLHRDGKTALHEKCKQDQQDKQDTDGCHDHDPAEVDTSDDI